MSGVGLAISELELQDRIVNHESLHRFGLQHGDLDGDDGPLDVYLNQFGIMFDQQLTPGQMAAVQRTARPR